MQLLVNRKERPFLLLLLGIIVFGSITLPMLPIWHGMIRILAGGLLVLSLERPFQRKMLSVLLLLLVTTALVSWLREFFASPFSHVVHSLTDIYGQPLDLISDGAILLFDLLCVSGLGILAYFKFRENDRLMAVFGFCVTAFWLWALMGVISAIFRGQEASQLVQVMTGASAWATWVYFALCAVLLLSDEEDVRALFGWIGGGGIVVASVVAIQWAIGDYSYVLDAQSFSDYFFRVRGTYYYHTAATYAMVLTSVIVLALVEKGRSDLIWLLFGAALMVAMITINNSRAMSLTLLVGMGVFLLATIRQKNYPVMIFAVIAVMAIAPNILYLKPGSGTTSTASSMFETTTAAGSQGEEGVDEIIVANQGRSQLFVNGLKILKSAMWVGSGIGILSIPLPGNAYNGLLSTYSTHTLYLDILLMAGIPALLFFLAVFLIAGWRALGGALVVGNGVCGNRAAALFAALAMFGIGSLFVPQERSEMIGIAFLLAALVMVRPVLAVKPRSREMIRPGRWAAAMVIAGVVGWSILTSPAYVFPAIELVLRHGQEIDRNNQQILVTEPGMKTIVEFLLRLKGARDPVVSILKDDIEALPADQSWVLWSPKRDIAYPRLRDELGYQLYRQGGQAPSIKLPSDWWVMPSSQPMVILSYVGPRNEIALPLHELARVFDVTGSVSTELDRSEIPYSYLIKDKQVSWSFQPRSDVIDEFKVAIVTYLDGVEIEVPAEVQYSNLKTRSGKITYSADHIEADSLVTLRGYLNTLPNRAHSVAIESSDERAGSEHSIADLNFGTAGIWTSDSGISVRFDFGAEFSSPIGIYRMVAFNFRDYASAVDYSWIVEGSLDGTVWQQLDQRNNVNLSKNADSPSAFLLPKTGVFQYYRFRFPPSTGDETLYRGMMELELYPLPRMNF